MNHQFLYFVAHPENRDLLKEEIKFFYPKFLPSFSKGGFLTFKNTGRQLSEQELKKLEFSFALAWGQGPQPITDEFISKVYLEARFEGELPSEAPSRAYLKIAETCQRFSINPNPSLSWIEFGSAPGGACFYLLQHYNKVWGVDPALMASSCLENPRFAHISMPIQNLKREHLPQEDIHWIASDLNLNPLQAISEVLRISEFYRSSLRGVLMTVKMVKKEHVKLIPKFLKSFERAGFRNVSRCQLFSHKREFLIVARPR